jgi:DNA-binding LytR/AlgR family response regulator
MNGMEFVDLLASKPYLVIVSSEEKYAVDAFSYSVVDYLLKPVMDKVRFLQAVYKVKALMENQHSKKQKEKSENLFVRADSLLQNIPLDSILWLEASSDYVKINTDKKMLMVLSTMKAISEKLPENQFVRVHRSFIVNIKRVENIDSSNLIIGNKIIPISTNYRDSLMAKINIL